MAIEIDYSEQKNAMNIAEHGFPLDVVEAVFADPHVLERVPTYPGSDPVRFKAVGRVPDPQTGDDVTLCVVYTPRDGRYRVISVRVARRNERAAYEQAKRQA